MIICGKLIFGNKFKIQNKFHTIIELFSLLYVFGPMLLACHLECIDCGINWIDIVKYAEKFIFPTVNLCGFKYFLFISLIY